MSARLCAVSAEPMLLRAQRDDLVEQHGEAVLAVGAPVPVGDAAVHADDGVGRRLIGLDHVGRRVGEAHRRPAAPARQGVADGQGVAGARAGRPGDGVRDRLIDVARVQRVLAHGRAVQGMEHAGVGQLLLDLVRPAAQRPDAIEEDAAGEKGAGREAGADQEAAARQAGFRAAAARLTGVRAGPCPARPAPRGLSRRLGGLVHCALPSVRAPTPALLSSRIPADAVP